MRLSRRAHLALGVAGSIAAIAIAAPAAQAATDLKAMVVGGRGTSVGGSRTWDVVAIGNGDPVNATLIVQIPPVLELVSFAASPAAFQPQCSGIASVTCTLPAFGGGSSLTLTLTLRGARAGQGAINASIGTLDTAEEDLANNQSSAQVEVSGGSPSTGKPKCGTLRSKKAAIKCTKAVAACVQKAKNVQPSRRQRALGACYDKARRDFGVR